MLLTRGILLCKTNPTLRRGRIHTFQRVSANGLPNPGVAQSGRAGRLGRQGRRFESFHPDQLCERGGMVTQQIANLYNAGSSPVAHSN